MLQHHYYLPSKLHYKYSSHLPVLTSRTNPRRERERKKKGKTEAFSAYNFYNPSIQNVDKERLNWAILSRQIINLVVSVVSMETTNTCGRGCVGRLGQKGIASYWWTHAIVLTHHIL